MIDVKFRPEQIAATAFIAANATLVGDVTIGESVSVLFNAVLRGDTAALSVGNESNIQDLSCLHADPGFPCTIGKRVTIGHRAIVHGANIADDILIGMGAIILNGASIGPWSIIATGALVPEGKTIPAHSLVMGTPGRIIRQTTSDDHEKIRHAAKHYVAIGQAYKSIRQI